MEEQKKLTDAERQAITAKYERRITELGARVFGPEWFPSPGQDPVSIPEPSAEARALQQRILDSSIALLEAAPPPGRGEPPHRKPGDLNRTAERLRNEEVDLPEGFDREEEAASFDQYAKFARKKIAFGREMDAVANTALIGLIPILMTLKNFAIDLTHILKEWAREDPDGPGAAHYRDFNRALKQGAARPRRRR